MSDLVAASTGWPAGSPFQHELAFYHLGSGIVGTLCLWWRDRFWVAAGLAPSVFAYGAAIIHVREFVQHGNVAPANWGFAAVGANLIIPSVVLGLLFVYLSAGASPRTLRPDGLNAFESLGGPEAFLGRSNRDRRDPI